MVKGTVLTKFKFLGDLTAHKTNREITNFSSSKILPRFASNKLEVSVYFSIDKEITWQSGLTEQNRTEIMTMSLHLFCTEGNLHGWHLDCLTKPKHHIEPMRNFSISLPLNAIYIYMELD